MAIKYKKIKTTNWMDKIPSPSRQGCSPPPAPLRPPIEFHFDYTKSWGYMRQALINTAMTTVRQTPIQFKVAEAHKMILSKTAESRTGAVSRRAA